MRFDQTIVGIG